MQKWDKEIDQATIDNEKAVLEALKKNYQDALEEIKTKIAILLGRKDADMMHVIYQVEYQEALKTQIEGILDMLQANEFETISEYLTTCYEEGYMGALYSMQEQGVPLMLPLDQEQIVKAIQHDTMLSESLYDSLGKDVQILSKQIAGEISRGISTGKMYNEIAKDINGYARIGMNNAMRIARTEGHRIQSEANYNAQVKAKSKGADIVKVWSSALDGKTRSEHLKLDGQKKEVNEPFKYGRHTAMYPGEFGVAHLDINCRCRARTIARWLLDAEQTKMLGDVSKMSEKQKEIIAKKLGMKPEDLAQYSGQIVPVKAKDYADFKRQYNKLWRYEGSELQEKAEARIAELEKVKNEKRVRLSPQKMKVSTEHTQNYKKVEIDNNNKVEVVRNKAEIYAYKITTAINDIHLSSSVMLKPRELHIIDKNATDAMKKLGISNLDHLPKIVVINSKEMQTGALASFNPILNILYVDRSISKVDMLKDMQKEFTCPDSQLSTFTHELIHWKDAEQYIKKYGSIDSVEKYNDYIRWANNESKKKLDKLAESGYNILDISDYATQNYIDGMYNETYTEYRVQELLKG